MERMHEIVFQGWVDGLRILLGLESRLVDANQFLSLAGLLAEAVIGNAIKPGRKFRLAAKAADVFVSAQKSFLGQIVGQGEVAPRELPQETTHRRLVIAHQFGEGVVIIIEKNPCDKIGIIERHAGSLHLGGRVCLVDVQSPDEQVAQSDQKRNDAQAPDAAFPVVDGAEEDH